MARTGPDPGLPVDAGSPAEPDYWKFDMHVHSWYSGDSTTDPSRITGLFEKQGVISMVCDHNNTAGSAAVSAEIHTIDPDIPVILSEEIMTASGEIIGLFLTEEVQPYLSAAETVDLIHDQGGLTLVPHPFCTYRTSSALRHDTLDEIIDRVDIIEGYNARVLHDEDNARAREYAILHGKPVSVGSDAHTIQELGRCFMELEPFTSPGELLRSLGSGRAEFCRMDRSVHDITRLVKAIKHDRLREE